MTLAEVAETVRMLVRGFKIRGEEATRLENVVKMFEADPDFKLRERIEALALEFGPHAEVRTSLGTLKTSDVALRLHAILNPPKAGMPNPPTQRMMDDHREFDQETGV